jgi:hypothetical protein
MKSFKILSLLMLAAVAMVGCQKNNSDNPGGGISNVSGIVKEWRIATWAGETAPFDVYIDFNEDGSYEMFPQVYSLYYERFSGNYTLSGDIVTGTYSDGSNWKSAYKASLSSDGMQLTLHSQEDVSIESVYNSTIIPDAVKAEATTSRSVEVEPFL